MNAESRGTSCPGDSFRSHPKKTARTYCSSGTFGANPFDRLRSPQGIAECANFQLLNVSCCRFDGHPVKLIPPCARTQLD